MAHSGSCTLTIGGIAYLFQTEDLDEPAHASPTHISDISPKDMVTWNIDFKQMGVGGDTSWEPTRINHT